MKFGIERLLADPALRAPLHGRRVALLAHPASVTRDLTHSLDALAALGDVDIERGVRAAARPAWRQAGQYDRDRRIISIRSTASRCSACTAKCGARRGDDGQFDVMLIDLQDVGCRIYTFITTLLYMLEAAAEHGKSVWVLDRPNPAGRPVEGTTLSPGWESFVGAGPIPMRHGLTLGELGHWFVAHFKIDVDYRVIAMEGYAPDAAPGFGWPRRAAVDQPVPERAQRQWRAAMPGR